MNTPELVQAFLVSHGYRELNVTQQKCVDSGVLDTKENFLVVAPTGGGKTGVAELLIRRSLDEDPPERVIYVAPLKSLMAANLEEFKKHLPGRKVMPLWGKNALREADVVVALNEHFYKTILKMRDTVGNFSVLVLDELHLMYQASRGHTVEKILTLAKHMGIRIVCLSATIEDKEELRSWLNAVLVEVPETQRPIPLVPHDFAKDGFVGEIRKFNKPPVLIFRSKKRDVEATAKALASAIEQERGRDSHLSQTQVRSEIQSRMSIDMTERLGELAKAISNGVAWHHAELPPKVREYVEDLYAAKKIDFIVATTTLAYGFDSPTRTVVIHDLTRWTGEKNEPIGVHEFRQMAGRAGRPSKTEFKEGYVCGVFKSAGDQKELARYRTAKLEPVQSHLGAIDDYFKKAVMEFVYSGSESADAISNILSNSFYRSRRKPGSFGFGLYDPVVEARRHLTELVRAEYIHSLADETFRLSKVGQFIVEFQLDRFESFDHSVFSELNRYVQSFPAGSPIPFNPKITYQICKTTDEVLTSNRRAVPDDTQKTMVSLGWKVDDPIGRTSLAINNGWMTLMATGDIETRFGVQSDAIEAVCRSLANDGFFAFVELARLNSFQLEPVYSVLSTCLTDGVPPELVPLVNIKDIARKRAEGIVKACDAMILTASVSPPYDKRPSGSPMVHKGKVFAKKGDRVTGRNCLVFLRNFLAVYGEGEVSALIQKEHGIGPVIAGKVLELLKSEANR